MVNTATARAAKVSTLLVTSLGSFMVLLDGSIVLVALPTIQQDLHAQVADLQWTVDAYTLPFAALMLTAGTLGDRLGRKKVFLAGLLLFLVGSAVCGFSTTFGVLILGRVIQGLGAAAISTGSLALLVSTFTQPAERAKAIGIWTAVSGVSLAAGPLVGGLLIEAFNWPAIFFINLPIGLLALALGVPKLLESSNPQARSIDLPGQIAVTGALFCIVMALIEGPRAGWGSGLIIALFAVGAILLVGFIGYERRAREPMLPVDLFKKPSFSTACVSAFLLGFIIVGVMFFMAQFLQGVQGNTALGAGLRLLPLTLGIFVMSPPAARITGKVGPRPPITVGALLSAVGFLLLTQVNPDTGYASILWRLLLVGLGIGCMFAPLTVAIMAATPPNRGGLGSSMINTFRIVGFTAGAAVLGTVVLSRFSGNIVTQLSQRGVPSGIGQDVVDKIASAGAFASSAPVSGQLPIGRDELTDALHTAFTGSIHVAFVISAICMLVTAGLAVAFLGGRPPAMPGGPGAAGGPGAPGAAGGPGAPGAPGAPAVGPTAQPAPVGTPVPSLVESDWLADRLGAPNLVVIDCTVQHYAPPTGGIQLNSGLPGYREGHIPGARFADLLTEFANTASPKPFALPTQAAFTAALRSLGVNDGDHIVVYDRAHTAWATRFWWMLQVFGVDNVSVLNGGWTKWTAEHRPVATDVPAPSAGNVTLHARPQLVASAADVQAATADSGTCLINALSPDQHQGRVPVAHGRSGHIESSVNVPAVALIDPATGAFRPVPELRAMFDQAGALQARSVIAYCAAGVNATSDAFALKLVGGPEARVYDGGLVEWSADPELPLVVTAGAEV
jgi:EmrB/QacA subfamily drug resistance transporter